MPVFISRSYLLMSTNGAHSTHSRFCSALIREAPAYYRMPCPPGVDPDEWKVLCDRVLTSLQGTHAFEHLAFLRQFM